MKDLNGGLLFIVFMAGGITGLFICSRNHQKTEDYTLVEMNASAYCPCGLCCGKWSDGITASGKPATGKLIAAPRNYAFGTVMDVPGYGRAVVRDRGGAITGNKIDLLFPTHQEALEWGRKKHLPVKVYKEPSNGKD